MLEERAPTRLLSFAPSQMPRIAQEFGRLRQRLGRVERVAQKALGRRYRHKLCNALDLPTAERARLIVWSNLTALGRSPPGTLGLSGVLALSGDGGSDFDFSSRW